MPYVARDKSGQISEISARKTKTAHEKLGPNDPDLRKFLGKAGDSKDIQDALITSDLGLIRVLEDLIAVLIDKRIIVLTDLPKMAQQKLARRYELRSELTDLGEIVNENEQIMLP